MEKNFKERILSELIKILKTKKFININCNNKKIFNNFSERNILIN